MAIFEDLIEEVVREIFFHQNLYHQNFHQISMTLRLKHVKHYHNTLSFLSIVLKEPSPRESQELIDEEIDTTIPFLKAK